jgi:hypothetical protein
MVYFYPTNMRDVRGWVQKFPAWDTKVSGLKYKSRAKWKMLRGIYSAIYGEINVLVAVCVEIKGDYIEK